MCFVRIVRKEIKYSHAISLLLLLSYHRRLFPRAVHDKEFPVQISTSLYTTASFSESSLSDDEPDSASDFDDAVVEMQWSDDEGNLYKDGEDKKSAAKQLHDDNGNFPDKVSEDDNLVMYGSESSRTPLQTVQKLQQMLEETDYMTVRRSNSKKTFPSHSSEKIVTQSYPQKSPAPEKNRDHQVNEDENQDEESLKKQDQLNLAVEITPEQNQNEEEQQQPSSPSQHSSITTDSNLNNQKYQTQQHEQQQRYQDISRKESTAEIEQRHQKELEQKQQHSSLLPSQLEHQKPVVTTQPDQNSKRSVVTTQPDQNSKRYQRRPSSPLHIESLWTSKDRSKYKKIRQMQRRAEDERRRLAQLKYLEEQQQVFSDDEVDTDDATDNVLKDIPIYMSDAEDECSDHEFNPSSPSSPQYARAIGKERNIEQQQQKKNALQQGENSNTRQTYDQTSIYKGAYPSHHHQQQHMTGPYVGYPPPPYFYNPNYNQHYSPQQQQQLMSQYAAQWHYYHQQRFEAQKQLQDQQFGGHEQSNWIKQYQFQRTNEINQSTTPSAQETFVPSSASFQQQQQQLQEQQQQQQLENFALSSTEMPETLAEATSHINFDSVQKACLLLTSVAMLAYCAVSPRHLPLAEYNRFFYENMRIVALVAICPLITFLLVCDARENNVNSVITAFYTSFTVGYAISFVLEILSATIIRLLIFLHWEPNIFKSSPKVPALVLPWVVREIKYRPKRITLFVADFFTSCLASPIIEEYTKLFILHLSVKLPRNFQWYMKKSTENKKKKRRRVAEAVRNANEPQVTNINSYVTHMLAVSLGMKLCDAVRRILMYTKASQPNKSIYAFFRGLFPIHELCGTMTVLALAKRNVLGVDMPLWQILFPAVFIHGMANFRGMKPIFKWSSATPWSEMQLSPWNVEDDSTLPQLLSKCFAKLMWLIIQARVLGYCIKNYYLISRQARKRTTTYAGKESAFSAELETAKILKKIKDK